MNCKRIIPIWLFVLLTSLAPKPDAAGGDISHDLKELFARDAMALIEKPPYSQAHWGVCVMELTSGDTVFELNSDKLFMPASNRKLFSSAFALDQLGADYRFSTRMERTGAIDASGTLDGNLIVRASGDPTISGEFRDDSDPMGVFEDWADALRKLGVRRVKGDIVVDESMYDSDTSLGEGWSWDYESSYYAAPVGAFSFNENVVYARVSPGSSSGNPCRVSLTPISDGFLLRNDTTTKSRGANTIETWRERGTNVIVVKGSLPRRAKTEYNAVTVDNPGRFAAYAMASAFSKKGVPIEGKTRLSRHVLEEGLTVTEYKSPPLSDLLAKINSSSNNFLSEMIYLAAGAKATGSPANYDAARSREERFWKKIHLDDATRLYSADGSGLSRRNLFSPRSFCQLLRYMQAHADSEDYVRSMAVAGRQGTLAGRMSSRDYSERVVGKTGTIANVSCLSGYLIDDGGHTLVFSILVNNFTGSTSTIKRAQDQLCRMLIDLPGRQPAALALSQYDPAS